MPPQIYLASLNSGAGAATGPITQTLKLPLPVHVQIVPLENTKNPKSHLNFSIVALQIGAAWPFSPHSLYMKQQAQIYHDVIFVMAI